MRCWVSYLLCARLSQEEEEEAVRDRCDSGAVKANAEAEHRLTHNTTAATPSTNFKHSERVMRVIEDIKQRVSWRAGLVALSFKMTMINNKIIFVRLYKL